MIRFIFSLKQKSMKEVSFPEARRFLKEKGITEEQFYKWLVRIDKGESEKESLKFMVDKLYHSSEEHVYAPPHLAGILPKSQRLHQK